MMSSDRYHPTWDLYLNTCACCTCEAVGMDIEQNDWPPIFAYKENKADLADRFVYFECQARSKKNEFISEVI